MDKKSFYGFRLKTPPVFKRVLIIDDNPHYADRIEADILTRGDAEIVKAVSAAEGMAIMDREHETFDAIVTDMSMESEYAGTRVLRHARKVGFKGTLCVATTALDYWYGLYTTGLVFRYFFGADYLIPKRPINQEEKIYWLGGK
jgi:response regulator of citrate/malate metabolism